jgi:hypothetical protein
MATIAPLQLYILAMEALVPEDILACDPNEMITSKECSHHPLVFLLFQIRSQWAESDIAMGGIRHSMSMKDQGPTISSTTQKRAMRNL